MGGSLAAFFFYAWHKTFSHAVCRYLISDLFIIEIYCKFYANALYEFNLALLLILVEVGLVPTPERWNEVKMLISGGFRYAAPTLLL